MLWKTGRSAVAVVVIVVIVAVAVIYLWPHRSRELQTADSASMSYGQAMGAVHAQRVSDEARGVTGECRSRVLTHDGKTEGAVVFFHGIRVCPSQFDDLALHFFEAGYNVYLPVAPAHGTADPRAHGEVEAGALVDYVNESITIATGLGDEVGVVGLSGGGLLGTWAAHHREEVERLLVLSGFYEPASSEVPKWQLPLLKTLYGKHLLADSFSNGADSADPGFSYRGLAQYLIIGDNLRADPGSPALRSVATVIAEDDTRIDQGLAVSVPGTLAEANGLELFEAAIPGKWKVGHEIVNTSTPGVAEHRQELFQLYLDLYAGRPAAGPSATRGPADAVSAGGRVLQRPLEAKAWWSNAKTPLKISGVLLRRWVS
ncbi:alpha/beta fold hydrolase [Corynebacterium comes]|nr:alpha/beta fold hydrolase [Corynebacterium comes]